MDFTREQKNVIDFRGDNLLVSAAAGSGKTAVLVERIITKIKDAKAPVDIDSLLVMTFTRAAAAELKDRLSKRINKELSDAVKGNDRALTERLRRQSVLIRGAQISTIDGFCTSILRNHFGSIGLDPSFRVADDGELKILMQEVLGELLEDAYSGKLWDDDKDKTDRFYDFLARYSLKKNDKDVVEAIFKLYFYAQGKSNPIKWLEESDSAYSFENAAKLYEKPIVREYYRGCIAEISRIRRDIRRALDVCYEPDGPYYYANTIEGEYERLEGIEQKAVESFMANDEVMNSELFDYLKTAFSGFSFDRLSSKKDETVNADKRDVAKALREKYKKDIPKVCDKYFVSDYESVALDVMKAGFSVSVLKELAICFTKRFDDAKRERNIVDFSDLEHLSLKVLYDDDELTRPSDVAAMYRELFTEIMVDEYQDSNEVQEQLVLAICKNEDGKRNVFMVGDVKQSIYRFRQADPSLFIAKYKSYGLDNGQKEMDLRGISQKGKRIDLHRNFRSRNQVVKSVNFIFKQIMMDDVGGVMYDDDAYLVKGAEYKSEESADFDSELLLVNKMEDCSDREAEAMAVAEKIVSLVGSGQVQDKNSGELREIKYGDIAVLLRSMDKWDSVFLKVFKEYGIPVVAETKAGYFNSFEVNTLLSYLSVINNPRDDETLCAVMKSCFGNFSNEELSLIRTVHKDGTFSDAVFEMINDNDVINKNNACNQTAEILDLQEKIHKFVEKLQEYRVKATYLSVRELMDLVIRESHYDVIIRSMNNGEQRLMNVFMLLSRASQYEKINYRGIFNFIRYIGQLKRYEVDQGQAQLASQSDDCVKLMSIHKSKGLEFPVCFVSGLSKAFNTRDLSDRLVLDRNEGIGADCIDPVRRTKRTTIIKSAIAQILKGDNLGEELRVLYVALTRAREKLIMTGVISEDDLTKKVSTELVPIIKRPEIMLSVDDITNGSSYLSWILKALCRNKACETMMKEALTSSDYAAYKSNPLYDEELPVRISFMDEADFVISGINDTLSKKYSREYFEQIIADPSILEDKMVNISPAIETKEQYVPTKVSVSYIKHEAMEENGVDVFNVTKQFENEGADELVAPVPEFIKKRDDPSYDATKVAMIGSLRGTAYHRVFELIDYGEYESASDVQVYIDSLVERGLIESKSAQCVRPLDIKKFLDSDIGKRMGASYKNNLLKREQPFCFMVKASDVDRRYPSDRQILVQGIIDAIFLEDGEYVIVDYKTDSVPDIEELSKRYKTQLDYYAKAIEQITGIRVKEKIIYSVKFGCELVV